MRLCVAGKGGSGKTSISGTMARLLAQSGRRVIAIDADSNPNLSLTLGVDPGGMDSLPVLPRDLIRRENGGIALVSPLDEILRTHAVVGPDDVQLLIMALPQHADTGCLCSMHATVRRVVEEAATEPSEVCILDTEASPEHLSRGTAAHADAILIVVEPYYKSLETGRRMAVLARDLGIPRVSLVANKIRDERDVAVVREFAAAHELEIAGVIPFDDAMPEAERARAAPVDFAPDGAAVRAIGTMVEELVA